MVQDQSDLQEIVRSLAARAAEKLRQAGVVGEAVNVFLTGNVFRPDLPQHAGNASVALGRPGNDSRDILSAALVALSRVYRPGVPYKKAGVLMLGLTDPEKRPPRFIGETGPVRDGRVMKALDSINAKFGAGSINTGQIKRPRNWIMNQQFRSQRFTTRWDELPKVR